MILQKSVLHFLTTGLLLTAAGASNATITVHTTLASFQAAVGLSGTDTFDGFNVTQSTMSPITRSAGSFSYTADTGTVDGFFGGGDAANPFLSTNAAGDTITLLNFSAGVVGVGGNYFDSNFSGAYTAGSITVTATDAGGTETRTITPTSTSVGSFLGFVSDGPMTSVKIVAVQQGSGFRWPGVDDLTLAIAVPEPGTHALMLCGLGSLGLLVRRRRRA